MRKSAELFLYGLYDFEPNDSMICMSTTGRRLQFDVLQTPPTAPAQTAVLPSVPRFQVKYFESLQDEYGCKPVEGLKRADVNGNDDIAELLIFSGLERLGCPSVFDLPEVLERLVYEYLKPARLDNGSVLVNNAHGCGYTPIIERRTKRQIVLRDDDEVIRIDLRKHAGTDMRLLPTGNYNDVYDSESNMLYQDSDTELSSQGICAIPVDERDDIQFVFVTHFPYNLFGGKQQLFVGKT